MHAQTASYAALCVLHAGEIELPALHLQVTHRDTRPKSAKVVGDQPHWPQSDALDRDFAETVLAQALAVTLKKKGRVDNEDSANGPLIRTYGKQV